LLIFLSFFPGWLALFAQEGGAAGGGGFESLFGNLAIPLAFTFLLMYLFLLRPDQKKRKEQEKQLAAIKKNDHVVTVGGIFGTVVAASADSKFITIRGQHGNKIEGPPDRHFPRRPPGRNRSRRQVERITSQI
jgi:preprotein translocase YajC subunit